MKTCKKSEIIQGTFGICTKERHDFSPSTGGASVTSHKSSSHQNYVWEATQFLAIKLEFKAEVAASTASGVFVACVMFCRGEPDLGPTVKQYWRWKKSTLRLCWCWNCWFWCWNWRCWWKGCFCRWWFWCSLWHFCTLLPRCCTKESSSLLHDNLNLQSLKSPPQFWKFMYIRWCKEHSTVYNRRLSWLGNFLSCPVDSENSTRQVFAREVKDTWCAYNRANWDWFESMIERMSESQSYIYI